MGSSLSELILSHPEKTRERPGEGTIWSRTTKSTFGTAVDIEWRHFLYFENL